MRFLVRSFMSYDGSTKSKDFKVGEEVSKEKVKEYIQYHDSKLVFDHDIAQRAGYDYYRLYLGDGTLVVLQDLLGRSDD